MILFSFFILGIIPNFAYIMAEPPTYFMQDDVNIIIPEYSSVIMPCHTNIIGTSETWFKNGELVHSNLTVSFRIRLATRDMAGIYHCHANNNDGGIRSKRMRLTVGYLDRYIFQNMSMTIVDLVVGEAGIIWLGKTIKKYQNRENSFQVDENITKGQENWHIQSAPAPQISWTLNNRPISSSRYIFISQVEQILVLLNVKREMHAKAIKARLSNGYGNRKGVYSQAFVTQVKDAPTANSTRSLHLVLPPKDVTLVLRLGRPGVATFECVFNARPTLELNLQWFRKTGISGVGGTPELIEPTAQLQHGRTNYSTEYIYTIGQFNRSLTVSNIQVNTKHGKESDFHEEYICQGYLSNQQGSYTIIDRAAHFAADRRWSQGQPVSATARLTILIGPKLVYRPEAVSVPMKADLEGSLKAALIQTAVGSTLTVPCTVEHVGHPRAQVEWLKNANSISPLSDRFYVGEDSQLVISDVTFSDAGVYQCYAHNSAGEDFLNYWVNVSSFAPQLLPGKATHQVVSVTENSNLTLECPFFAAPLPTVIWYKGIDDSDEVGPEEPTPSGGQASGGGRAADTFTGYQLASVQHSDSGVYRCVAENVLGAKTADIRLHVIARTRPGSHMPGEITALEGDSLKLPCLVAAHSEHPVQIRWLHGRQKELRSVVDDRTDKAAQGTSTYEIDDRVTWIGDEEMQSQSKITGGSLKNYGSILRKHKLNLADTGVYVCQILSVGGNLTLVSELKVVRHPDMPENVSASCQSTSMPRSSKSLQKNDRYEQDHCATITLTFDIAMKQNVHSVQIYSSSYNPIEYPKGCQQIPTAKWQLRSLAPANVGTRKEREKMKLSLSMNGSFYQTETAYCFKVICVNSLGWSPDSAATTSPLAIPMQVPRKGKPVTLAYHDQDGKAVVAWIHSPGTEAFITHYQLQYQKQGSVSDNKTVLVRPVTGVNRFYLDRLEEESMYELTVSKCNAVGCEPQGHNLTINSRKQRPKIAPNYLLIRSIGATHVEVVIPIDAELVGSFNGIQANLECHDPPGCANKQYTLYDTRNQDCRIRDAPNRLMTYLEHNTTSKPGQHDIFLNITGLESSSLYDLQVALLNSVGRGPLSVIPEVFRTAEEKPPVRLSALTVTWKPEEGLLAVSWQEDSRQAGDITGHLVTCRKFISFQQADGLTDSTDRCASGKTRQQLLKPYHQSLSVEKTGVKLHRVQVKHLCPEHFYSVTVAAVDQVGSYSAPVVTITYLGRVSNSGEGETAFSRWISFHVNRLGRRSDLVHIQDVHLGFDSLPGVRVEQGFTVHLSVKLWITQLSIENRNSEKEISRENIISLLKLQKWPIEAQRISDLRASVKSQNNVTILLDWTLVTLATCESITFVTRNSITVAGQRYNRYLLLVETAVAQLKAFSTYRLRIWSPIGTIFTGGPENASRHGKVAQCSPPSAWFRTWSTPPKAAPLSLRVFHLDSHRIKVMWQPLNQLAFGGTTGGYLLSVDRADVLEYKGNQLDSLSNAHFTTLAYSSGLQYFQNQTRLGSCGVESMLHQIDDLSAWQYTVEGLHLGAAYRVKVRAFTWTGKDQTSRTSGAGPHSGRMLLGPGTYAGPVVPSEGHPCHSEEQSIPQVRMESTRSIRIPLNVSVVITNESLLVKWNELTEVPRCSILQPLYQVTLTFRLLSVQQDGQISEKIVQGRIFSNDANVGSSGVQKMEYGPTAADDQMHFTWWISLTSVYDLLVKTKQYDLGCHELTQTSLTIDRANSQSLEVSASSASVPLEPLLQGTYLYVLNLKSIQFVPTANRSQTQRARLHLSWTLTNRFSHPLIGSKTHHLHWQRIDPVTHEAVGKLSVRPLIWPFPADQRGDASAKIIVDELKPGGTYQFHVSTGDNHTNCAWKERHTGSPTLRIAVVPREFIKPPLQRPQPPVQLISSPRSRDQAPPGLCSSAVLLLVWPAIPSSLTEYWESGGHIHPIHSSPVQNYTLQYALYQETSERQFLHHWIDYRTPAYPGSENGFLVHGLAPNQGYVFRLAAWTAAGPTPYSPVSNAMFTDPSQPCEAPTDFSFSTLLASKDHGEEISGTPAKLHTAESPQGKKRPSSLCQIFVLHWTGISESSWNSDAERVYRISYRSSFGASNTTQEESIFIQIPSDEVETSPSQPGQRPRHSFELKSLAKSTYYEVGIQAATVHGDGPLCETVLLVYSGLACEPNGGNRPASGTGVDTSVPKYTVNKGDWETSRCLVPSNLNCRNNPFIGATCSWDQVTCLQPMGYKVTLTDFGSVDSLTLNTTNQHQSHSLYVPPNVTTIEFGPNTELLITLLNLVTIDQSFEQDQLDLQEDILDENSSEDPLPTPPQQRQRYPVGSNNPFDLRQEPEQPTVEQTASFGLLAHRAYAVSVETLLPSEAAVYHQLQTEKEGDLLLMANTKSMTTATTTTTTTTTSRAAMTTATRSSCDRVASLVVLPTETLGTDYSSRQALCTDQLPPSRPHGLHTHWATRHQVQLSWLPPRQRNGRLTAHRVLVLTVGQGSADDQLASNQSVGGGVKVMILPAEAQSVNLEVAANATYWIEVTARTGSSPLLNGGWSRPSCLLLTSDVCALTANQEVHAPRDWCLSKRRVFQVVQRRKAAGDCGPLPDPEVYRPLIELSKVNLDPLSTSGQWQNVSSTQEAHTTSQDKDNHRRLSVSWKLTPYRQHKVSQFLLEYRTSSNSELWSPLAAVLATQREFNCSVDTLQSNRFSTGKPSVQHKSVLSDQQDSALKAAFADASVLPASPHHMAVQIRIIPIHRNHMGWPSDSSRWLILSVSNESSTSNRNVWLFLVAALFLFFAICCVACTLVVRYRKGEGMRKSHISKAAQSHRALASQLVVFECCRSKSALISASSNGGGTGVAELVPQTLSYVSSGRLSDERHLNAYHVDPSMTLSSDTNVRHFPEAKSVAYDRPSSLHGEYRVQNPRCYDRLVNSALETVKQVDPFYESREQLLPPHASRGACHFQQRHSPNHSYHPQMPNLGVITPGGIPVTKSSHLEVKNPRNGDIMPDVLGSHISSEQWRLVDREAPQERGTHDQKVCSTLTHELTRYIQENGCGMGTLADQLMTNDLHGQKARADRQPCCLNTPLQSISSEFSRRLHLANLAETPRSAYSPNNQWKQLEGRFFCLDSEAGTDRENQLYVSNNLKPEVVDLNQSLDSQGDWSQAIQRFPVVKPAVLLDSLQPTSLQSEFHFTTPIIIPASMSPGYYEFYRSDAEFKGECADFTSTDV